MSPDAHVLLLTEPDVAWLLDYRLRPLGVDLVRNMRAFDRAAYLQRLQSHKRGLFRLHAVVVQERTAERIAPDAVELARSHAPDVGLVLVGRARDKGVPPEAPCRRVDSDRDAELVEAVARAVRGARTRSAGSGTKGGEEEGLPTREALEAAGVSRL